MHYNTARHHERMMIARGMLGGACGRCGVTEGLHFHHRDPATKDFDISSGICRPWRLVIRELEKCALRCAACHRLEHPPAHGISMYSHQKCRCVVCRSAWSARNKEYKRRRRERRVALTI